MNIVKCNYLFDTNAEHYNSHVLSKSITSILKGYNKYKEGIII